MNDINKNQNPKNSTTGQTAAIVITFLSSLASFILNASDFLKGLGIAAMTAVVMQFIYLKNKK